MFMSCKTSYASPLLVPHLATSVGQFGYCFTDLVIWKSSSANTMDWYSFCVLTEPESEGQTNSNDTKCSNACRDRNNGAITECKVSPGTVRIRPCYGHHLGGGGEW